jgi:hypothetical protein
MSPKATEPENSAKMKQAFLILYPPCESKRIKKTAHFSGPK